MKVLLYTEFENQIGKSGLGKAIKHQMRYSLYYIRKLGIKVTKEQEKRL